jgi:hypothetical protein
MSQRRIKANHRNCKKSTGPRTDLGKSRSSLNSLKHGLCSSRTLFPGESSELYGVFRKSIFTLLEPSDLIHADFANQIASALWRLRRASLIEDQLFTYSGNQVLSSPDADEDTALAQAWVEYDIHFCRLRRYQTAIERSLFTLLERFRGLQLRGIDKMRRGEYGKKRADRLHECLKHLRDLSIRPADFDVSALFDQCMDVHKDEISDPEPLPLRRDKHPRKSRRVGVAQAPALEGGTSRQEGSPPCRVCEPSEQERSPETSTNPALVPPHDPSCKDTRFLSSQPPSPVVESSRDNELSRSNSSRDSLLSRSAPADKLPSPAAPADKLPSPTVAEASAKPADSAPISAPAPVQTESCNTLSPEELAAKKEAEYLDWLRFANARRERQEMDKGRF